MDLRAWIKSCNRYVSDTLVQFRRRMSLSCPSFTSLQVGDPNNVKITITNDGATILRSVPVENPAAKVLVDIARIQDDTVGDGTTR